MNKSFIIQLNPGIIDSNENNIINEDIKTSSNICLPLCSLGFQNYLVRTKSYMDITKKLETESEIYYVVNPFEINISNYNDNIINLTKKHVNDESNSIDITFYKIWEILFLFDLLKKDECIFAIFSNNSNGILQAIINYKQYYKLDALKDKIFNISDEEVLVSSKIVKTHKGKHDITNIKSILSFKKEIDKSKKKANLIIADSGYETFKSIEPEMYNVLISEIIIALKIQEKDGHFILKVFETFTLPTLKLIYFVSSFYETIKIYKPYYSRPTLSEKYIIFKNFKYEHDTQNDKIKILENILLKIKTPNANLYDIWPNLKLSQEFLIKFKFINTKLSNSQQIMINDIVKYIGEENFFGEKYHMYRDNQIKATKWWINNFITKSDDFNINKHIDLYEADYNNFYSSLVKIN